LVVRGDSWLAICCATSSLPLFFQVGSDTSSPEGMVANPRFDTGRFRAPADNEVSVLLEKGIDGKLATG
jgi:hypothetical protein